MSAQIVPRSNFTYVGIALLALGLSLMFVRQFSQGATVKRIAAVSNGNCAFLKMRTRHLETYEDERVGILARSPSATDRRLAALDRANLAWIRQHETAATCK